MTHLTCPSGRELREGDIVRILSGTTTGCIAKVVGVALLSESPVIVQCLRESGYILEPLPANDLEFLRHQQREELKTLPPVSKLLAERSFLTEHCTGGALLGLRLSETKVMYTFCPLHSGTSLKEVYQEGGIAKLIEKAFITRMPDQVHYGMSKEIDNLIESNLTPMQIVDELVMLDS